MTLANAHKEGVTALLDRVVEIKASFSPEFAVEECADVLRAYGVTRVIGDHYGGEWPREAFRRRGIHYEASDRTKSQYYQDLLPLLNSPSMCDLLDLEVLISQLVSLECSTLRGARERIDHPQNDYAHDHVANAVAGAIVVTASKQFGSGNSPDNWSNIPGQPRQSRAIM